MALDAFAKQHSISFSEKSSFKSFMAQLPAPNSQLLSLFVKPQTFMNASGEAVQKLLRFYKIESSSLLVIHDEIDLPFGTLRVRNGGSSAGHNGLESIIQSIGPKFCRLRVGIANEYKDKTDAAEFVLSDFSKEEAEQLPAIFDNLSPLIQGFVCYKALD